MNKKAKSGSSKKTTTPTTDKKLKKRNKKSRKKSKSKESNQNTIIPPEIAPEVLPEEPEIDKDFPTLINEAIEKLSFDGNATKNDIQSIFNIFRNKLNEREAKLLHDVDTTVDKKSRVLQTQLEKIQDDEDNSTNELACDPNLSLKIDKQHIIRTLMTAGWIEGASSDNKEEQKMIEFEKKRRELSRQQFICIETLKEITIFERDCKKKREVSIRLTKECQNEIERVKIQTRECEEKLNEAKPLLEAAKKLVLGITKGQLSEIRVLKKPPRVIELVMTAVALILGQKVNNWRDIKKQLLSNPKFVSSILEFDTMELTKKRRTECYKCVKHQDFNEERANKASKVAGPLVKWVKSQIKYSELLDIVRPMMKEIKILKKKLEKKQKQLSDCNNLLYDLENKISKARIDINEMVDNMIKMQDKYNFKQDYFVEEQDDNDNGDVYVNEDDMKNDQ